MKDREFKEELDRVRACLDRNDSSWEYAARMVVGYMTAMAGTGEERTYTETQVKEMFEIAWEYEKRAQERQLQTGA